VFDVIAGLPVHALVVHAVVVLLPLMSLITIVFVVRPRWRRELPWAILGNAVVLAATYAAKESGEKLQSRLSAATQQPVAVKHGELGAVLPYYALALLVASVIAYLLLRRTTAGDATPSTARLTLAVGLVLVAGIAATVWTYRTGDSGARQVWEDTIANTVKPAG
jgi:hypothetical protein